jgi:hypothetical protein
LQLGGAQIAGVDHVSAPRSGPSSSRSSSMVCTRPGVRRPCPGARGWRRRVSKSGAPACRWRRPERWNAPRTTRLEGGQLLGSSGRPWAARVHGHGHLVPIAAGLQLGQRAQQLGRQVVHAVIAGIFQRVQGNGFPEPDMPVMSTTSRAIARYVPYSAPL